MTGGSHITPHVSSQMKTYILYIRYEVRDLLIMGKYRKLIPLPLSGAVRFFSESEPPRFY